MRREAVLIIIVVIMAGAVWWFLSKPEEEPPKPKCPSTCTYGCLPGTTQCREPSPLVCPSTCKYGCAAGTTQCNPEPPKPAVTKIDSCGNVNRSGELAHNLNSEGTCLVIQSDNIILDCRNNILMGKNKPNSYGVYLEGRSNVTIQNCIVQGYASGIFVDASSNISILDVRAVDSMGDGVVIQSSRFVLLNGAILSKNRNGLVVTYSENITLSNNLALNNRFGFRLEFSNITSLSANRICSSLNLDFWCDSVQISKSEDNKCGTASGCEFECSSCGGETRNTHEVNATATQPEIG